MARLPAVQKFIDEARAVFASLSGTEQRFVAIRPFLQTLLRDPALNEASRDWPFRNDPSIGYVENLLF